MKIEDLIGKLPPMKTGAELTRALEDIPPYSENVRNADTTTRLMLLSELYNIYIPTSMSHEIYSKLYLAMIRSLQKKCSQQAMHGDDFKLKLLLIANTGRTPFCMCLISGL